MTKKFNMKYIIIILGFSCINNVYASDKEKEYTGSSGYENICSFYMEQNIPLHISKYAPIILACTSNSLKYKALIQKQANYINEIIGYPVILLLDNFILEHDIPKNDYISGVYMVKTKGELAIAHIRNNKRGEIIEADLLLGKNKNITEKVILHELGHIIGLDHCPLTHSIMNPVITHKTSGFFSNREIRLIRRVYQKKHK